MMLHQASSARAFYLGRDLWPLFAANKAWNTPLTNILIVAVYLLEDIWQLVSTSGQDTALGIVEFINKRLAHKSPVVKQKVP